jgi:hypothetical protein
VARSRQKPFPADALATASSGFQAYHVDPGAPPSWQGRRSS